MACYSLLRSGHVATRTDEAVQRGRQPAERSSDVSNPNRLVRDDDGYVGGIAPVRDRSQAAFARGRPVLYVLSA
jgi:hypothetical protein